MKRLTGKNLIGLICFFSLAFTFNPANATTYKHVRLVDKGATAYLYIPKGMFEYNSSSIKPYYYKRLTGVASFLRTHKQKSLIINGYTTHNQNLADNRAQSITNYFADNKIPCYRILTKGFLKQPYNHPKRKPTRPIKKPTRSVKKTNCINTLTYTHAQPKSVKPVCRVNNTASNINGSKPYIPRLYLAGFGGYDDWTALGQADLLAPLLQNNNKNFFLYGQGRYGYNDRSWANNPWTGSLGLGYRQIVSNKVVIGGYVLGDYSETATGHDVTMVSPGIEALGRSWDYRINGYIPVGTHKWNQEIWADQLGDYKYLRPTGHIRYDAKYIFTEEAGIGVDTEFGHKLFKIHNTLVKGYVDGYYFNMQDNDDIYGGGIHITIDPINYLRFSIADTYDNHNKNVLMAGARISLYDIFSHNSKTVNENDLQRRLFEPLERNYATIGSGSNVRETGDPNDPHIKPKIDNNSNNQGYVEDDNAWYIVPDRSTTGNDNRHPGDKGTIENPLTYSELSLSDINSYNQDPSHGYTKSDLYFSTGNYYGSISLADYNTIFSMYGMLTNFKQPATDGNRPHFFGKLNVGNEDVIKNIIISNLNNSTKAGINIEGDQNVTLKNISVFNLSGDTDIGLQIKDSNNIIVENLTLGNASGCGGYSTGINIEGSHNVNLKHLKAYGPVLLGGKTGVEISNGSDITFDDLTLGTTDSKLGFATGIDLDGSTNILFKNTTVHAFENNGIVGLTAKNCQTITLDNVTIGQSNFNNPNYPTAISLDNVNTFNMQNKTAICAKRIGVSIHNVANLNLANSDITVTNNKADDVAYGIFGLSTDDNNISVTDNSKIKVEATQGNAYGILVGRDHQYSSNIYNNKILVEGSNISVAANYAGDSSKTGNAYGVAIGYGTLLLTKEGFDIYDNQININHANITVTANASGTDNQGNAYGVLIGANCFIPVDEDQYSDAIYKNYISITENSTIKAIGHGNNDYSGNGYGVAVGYGEWDTTQMVSTVPAFSMLIGGKTEELRNVITIDSSTITGEGHIDNPPATRTDHIKYAGRGFGVLVGWGGLKLKEGPYYYIDTQDMRILHNKITITDSSLISDSTNKGIQETVSGSDPYHRNNLLADNIGYGLLVGYAGKMGVTLRDWSSHKIQTGVFDTTLVADNSTFTAKTTGIATTHGMASLVCLQIGNFYGSELEIDANNKITINNNTFHIADDVSQTSHPFAIGLYAPENSGSINNDWSTTNKFHWENMLAPVGIEHGYGLLGPHLETVDYIQWNTDLQ